MRSRARGTLFIRASLNLFPKAATVPAPCGTTPSAAIRRRALLLRMNLSLEHEKALLEKCDSSPQTAFEHHGNFFARRNAHDSRGHRTPEHPFCRRCTQDRQETEESPGHPFPAEKMTELFQTEKTPEIHSPGRCFFRRFLSCMPTSASISREVVWFDQSGAPLIHVENLCKSFEDGEVLKNVSIDIREGDLVSVIGPSGCGKSTFYGASTVWNTSTPETSPSPASP
jgi:ABC-type multidrug transport system fused ATPase/permease subunit